MPKAKTSKKTKSSKSGFIRQQPATMSAAEIIAKAKATGLTIRPGLVYEVRRAAKAKGAAKKRASMVTKKSTKPVQSKADFVRANRNLSPQEIVAKAKTEGIKLAVDYVYNVRGADKAARKKKRAGAKVNTSTTSSNGAGPSANSNAEALLKAIGAELGLGKAIEILSGEQARVRAVIGG
jgi:hypothetical protein